MPSISPRPRTVIGLALALLLTLSLVAPTAAGGTATVELDEPMVRAPIGEPVTIGFRILQHGVSPVADAVPVLAAIHRETRTEFQAIGVADGEIGHYIVLVTFPLAGEWKWGITPEPFPQTTTFPTVTAMTATELAADPALPTMPEEEVEHPAAVVSGGCGAFEGATPLFDLNAVAPLGDEAAATDKTESPIVKESATTLPIALSELATGDHAIVVQQGNAAGAAVCGVIIGRPVDGQGEVVVGLSETDDSGYVGFARLSETDGQTTITVYLSSDLSGPATIEITINDVGFSPGSVSVAAGQTVTWINTGQVAHTIGGGDLMFDDSGVLHPGESFSQTFDAPGTYSYSCGPHPNMVGTITVT